MNGVSCGRIVWRIAGLVVLLPLLLSAVTLSGDIASRPGTSDSVIDVARSLLELSQRSDECIKRLMDVRASAQDLEGPPLESASDSLGQISQRS